MIAFVVALTLAGTPITLEQVRTQSRQNTQALLSATELFRAENNVGAARSGIYPQVALNAGTGARYQGPQRQFGTFQRLQPDGSLQAEPGFRDIPESTNGSFDLSVTISQLIYDGGKWWKRIEQAGAQEDAARGQFLEQQLASEFEGVRRFFELYRAQERKRVLEANVRRSQDQVARAEGLFEAGKVGRGDLLAARVNLGNDRISALQQGARIVTTRADLTAWLTRSSSEDLDAVAPPLTSELEMPSFDGAVDSARKGRPLYRALDAQVHASEVAIDISRGDYLPRISAQVTGGRQGPTANPYFTDLAQQNSVTGGVNLRWDLFNGFATDVQTQNARAQLRTAELNLKQALYELEADVKRGLFSVDVQLQATRIALANKELAAESLIVAEGRFAQGAGSTLEVRDAQLKLTQAELQLLETQIDVEIARANLARVLGQSSNGVTP